MKFLSNKVALITGASSGIGRASAKLFAQHGANVVVGARRQDALDDLVLEIKDDDGQALRLQGDVTDEAYSKALVELAVQTYGVWISHSTMPVSWRLSICNRINPGTMEDTINTNLTGAFLGGKTPVGSNEIRCIANLQPRPLSAIRWAFHKKQITQQAKQG